MNREEAEAEIRRVIKSGVRKEVRSVLAHSLALLERAYLVVDVDAAAELLSVDQDALDAARDHLHAVEDGLAADTAPYRVTVTLPEPPLEVAR